MGGDRGESRFDNISWESLFHSPPSPPCSPPKPLISVHAPQTLRIRRPKRFVLPLTTVIVVNVIPNVFFFFPPCHSVPDTVLK